MDPLTLRQAVEFLKGKLLRGNASCDVTGVWTDTRNLKRGELFLALSGDQFDGHDFLRQAEATGALGAVVSRAGVAAACGRDFALVEVADTLAAYQSLAAAYREYLPLRVVAITGSNGKTSTKDFAAAVLARRFRVLKTAGNLNNHVGVPLTLLRASKEDEIAVLEMGMNHPGEIKPLADMAKPDVAIITNIGTAHIEYMGSREAIAQEKGMLVEAVGSHGHVILPADDPFAASLASRTSARVLTGGLRQGDFRAENVRGALDGSRFDIIYEGQRVAAGIAVPGEHMIVNALLAVAAGVVLGLSLQEAAEGLASATLTKGRLQVKKIRDFQVIDDSYNANPDSMVAALTTIAALPTTGRRIAVLGKMGELGIHSEEGHRRVGSAAAAAGFDCVIAVGSEASTIARYAVADGVPIVHALADTDEAASLVRKMAGPDDLILIKGSRSAGMERVAALLATFESETLSAAH